MIENNNEPFLIDTNILVYALDNSSDSLKHELAKNFIEMKTLSDNCFLSSQNLSELFWVLTKKILQPVKPVKARELLQTVAESFFTITYSEKTVIEAATLTIFCGVSFWDCLIAATMKEHGIFVTFTENTKDFSKIPGITPINPFIQNR